MSEMDLAERISFRGHGGIALAADVRGPAAGRPVLLLHGGGQTRRAWDATADVLAKRGFRCTTLDLRGHGESAWSPDGIYRLELFAEDVRHVISEIGGAPILIGASLGGLSSMLACGEEPRAPLSALVLVDIVPRLERSGGDHVVGFMRGTKDGFDSLEQAAEAIAAYLPHRPRPRSLDGLAKNLRRGEDDRYYWRWDPAFVRPRDDWDPEATNRRLSAALQTVDAPILLVRGTRSEVVSEESLRDFKALRPDAEIAEIADARHMVAGDDNDAFLTAIIAFVARRAEAGEARHG
ncbi:MAG: alpha/beta fold hydrolase [Sphingomonas sp.]|nr:alpha/beta fold hydrolase [Sphingomonas sp.]MDX3886281.1 alpha/beta fold hydrolase [Sphingomonas sp.]